MNQARAVATIALALLLQLTTSYAQPTYDAASTQFSTLGGDLNVVTDCTATNFPASSPQPMDCGNGLITGTIQGASSLGAYSFKCGACTIVWSEATHVEDCSVPGGIPVSHIVGWVEIGEGVLTLVGGDDTAQLVNDILQNPLSALVWHLTYDANLYINFAMTVSATSGEFLTGQLGGQGANRIDFLLHSNSPAGTAFGVIGGGGDVSVVGGSASDLCGTSPHDLTVSIDAQDHEQL